MLNWTIKTVVEASFFTQSWNNLKEIKFITYFIISNQTDLLFSFDLFYSLPFENPTSWSQDGGRFLLESFGFIIIQNVCWTGP